MTCGLDFSVLRAFMCVRYCELVSLRARYIITPLVTFVYYVSVGQSANWQAEGSFNLENCFDGGKAVNAASFCAMGHGSSELNVESGKKAFYRRRSCLCRFHGEYSFRRLPLDVVFAHLVRSDVRLSDRSGFKG